MADNTHPLDVVIMAAGKGTRMKSKLPKVLHRLAGRALLQHVVDTAATLNARRVIVVTGHGAMEVEAALAHPERASGTNDHRFELKFVRQEPQNGTGHAVQQAVPALPDDGIVVVLSGDVPLTQPDTLRQLIAACGGSKLALLTLAMANPTGYGRIVRGGVALQGDPQGNPHGNVMAIVELRQRFAVENPAIGAFGRAATAEPHAHRTTNFVRVAGHGFAGRSAGSFPRTETRFRGFGHPIARRRSGRKFFANPLDGPTLRA